MRSRAGRDQAAADTATVDRVRGALERYLAEGGPGVAVSVTHVLDLLNPRGMWFHDPEYRKAARQQAGAHPVPVTDSDPLTGCRPVTPPGGGG